MEHNLGKAAEEKTSRNLKRKVKVRNKGINQITCNLRFYHVVTGFCKIILKTFKVVKTL